MTWKKAFIFVLTGLICSLMFDHLSASLFGISTKAKPFARPVSRSVITRAFETSPQAVQSTQPAANKILSVDTGLRQYMVFRNKTEAEKETLFKNINFIHEVPAGALVKKESTVNAGLMKQAKEQNIKTVFGSLRQSSISNVAFVRKSGMKVGLMTAENINDVITGLILQPDYLVLSPNLDLTKIKEILLKPEHNASKQDPGFIVNYPAGISQRTKDTEIRVMSYNILAQCWGSEMPPVPERALMIADVIKTVAPDFAGLQELDSVWYVELEKLIKPYRFARNPYKECMCAVIYDSTKYKQVDGGVLPYTNKTIRCLRYTLLEDLKNGKKILVTNTHWDLTVEKRLKNANLMLQQIKDLQKKYPGIPVVCTGDFNCSVLRKELQLFLQGSGFIDTSDAAPISENKMVASWISPRYAVTPLPNSRQIDHVIVSGDWHILSAKLLFAPKLLQSSDHLPIVTDLKYK